MSKRWRNSRYWPKPETITNWSHHFLIHQWISGEETSCSLHTYCLTHCPDVWHSSKLSYICTAVKYAVLEAGAEVSRRGKMSHVHLSETVGRIWMPIQLHHYIHLGGLMSKFWFNNNNQQRQCLWWCPRDHGHCESSPGSFDECRLSAGWPPTLRPSQPTWAVSPPINGCYHPHSPSSFVIITRPESWYSFYRPTEGGRLSRPRHCRFYGVQFVCL